MLTDFFSYPHNKQPGVHPNLTENLFKPDFPTEMVKEGKVTVLVPNLAAYVTEPSEYAPSKAPVFYNPVMELNRDISVLALQVYQRMVKKTLKVCEPLASSGVRGLRYAAEIHGIKNVLVNDISTRAVQLAKQNLQLNNLEDTVSVSHKDANCLLGCHGAPQERFDVVDLDPFGTPARYMDAAVRALRDNGLWCLTATDLAPLCGVHARACIRKYGGRPLRTEYCHELAVRILAGCAATVAAKHEIGIRFLFSHSTDHYIRVYATVKFGAKKADDSLRNMGYLLHCFNCLHRETTMGPFTIKIENCPECGSRMDYAGPLWLGKILDNQFCKSVLSENRQRTFKNSAKITKLLSLAIDEVDAPLTYFVIDKISAKLGLPAPSVTNMLNLLSKKGFEAIPTHFNTRGIKTNAPAQTILELVKSFLNEK